MDIKVSVIVPIYNVEKYIEECLDSILKQTIKDIEIICINDNSPDNSIEIVEKYKSKDNRIKLINHNYNLGLGESRNSGIRIAQGDYIVFVDSDDYIDEYFVENLLNTASKYNSDIVFSLNIISIYKDRFEKYKYNNIDEWKNANYLIEGLSNCSIENLMYNTNEFPNVMSWNKIWKTDFIKRNNLFFQLKDRGEDIDVFYRALAHDPIIAFNHNSIYYYRQRENSIVSTRGKDFKFISQSIEWINNNIEYYKKYNISKLKFLLKEISYNILYEINNYKDQEEAYKYIHKYFSSLDLDISECDTEYIIFYILKYSNDYKLFNLFCINNEVLKNEVVLLKNEISMIRDSYCNLYNKFNNLVNILSWFIPIRKLRDKFRDLVYK